jgi:hypothetical protein
MKLLHGDAAARLVSERIGTPVATLTVLKSTPASRRVNGQIFHCLADNTVWEWVDAAVCSGDDVLAVNPTDAPSTGRFMRMPGRALLALDFTATTPTGTNLLTVPSNTILRPDDFAVKVTRVFTGASNAAIALSSSNILGKTGAAQFMGTFVATMLNNAVGPTAGGTGTDFHMSPVASGTFDTFGNRRRWMKGGDTFRLDVIGAQFGTGVGQVLVACDILKNPGV